MKKSIIILLLFFCYSTDIFSQEVLYKDYDNIFGLKASNISGYGFYYKRNVDEDFSLQIMGLAYYYMNKDSTRTYLTYNYDIGAEIQRNVYKSPNSRLFVLLGAYYYFDHDSTKYIVGHKNTDNNSYNVGVGAGWEFFYKRFVFNVDIGYKFYEDRKVITEINKQQHPELYRVTKIGAGVGIGFLF